MIRFLITLILSLMVFLLIGQSVGTSELDEINGNWAGTLTYTDYRDDSSQSTLECKMESKWKGNNGRLTFLFTEPNGKVIKDKTKIKLRKNGTKVIFDGKYKVTEFNSYDNQKRWKLKLETKGKDNKRTAKIWLVIELERNSFEIIKMVQYQGTDHSFERNRYFFEREGDRMQESN